MDAYCDYVRQASEARLSELRREADQYRLAQSLTATTDGAKTRRSWFRLGRRAAAARQLAKPVRLPHSMPSVDEDMRRIA